MARLRAATLVQAAAAARDCRVRLNASLCIRHTLVSAVLAHRQRQFFERSRVAVHVQAAWKVHIAPLFMSVYFLLCICIYCIFFLSCWYMHAYFLTRSYFSFIFYLIFFSHVACACEGICGA